MGLDMYLIKCKKIKELGIELTITLNAKFGMSEEVEDYDFQRFLEKYSYLEKRNNDTADYHYLFKKVAYWRKANHIHKWIYENCAKDDKKDYDLIFIDKNHLIELVKVLEDICEHKNDIEYAKENLPTQSGFFFGSVDYDLGYYEDCQSGINQLKKGLSELKDDEIVYYYASY